MMEVPVALRRGLHGGSRCGPEYIQRLGRRRDRDGRDRLRLLRLRLRARVRHLLVQDERRPHADRARDPAAIAGGYREDAISDAEAVLVGDLTLGAQGVRRGRLDAHRQGPRVAGRARGSDASASCSATCSPFEHDAWLSTTMRGGSATITLSLLPYGQRPSSSVSAQRPVQKKRGALADFNGGARPLLARTAEHREDNA